MKDVLTRKFGSEFWTVFGPGILTTLIGFILALSFVGAPPPKVLRFASGSNWGAYNKFAHEYQELLAEQGIEVEVIETHGSRDNMKLLSEGKADIAFVQGGILPEDQSVALRCLGSVYFEPLWVFVRGGTTPRLFSELEGMRVAIGSKGSGTRAVALELLEDSGVLEDIIIVETDGNDAEAMLAAGEIDVVIAMGPPTIKAINTMLKTEGVHLMQYQRAKAIERRHQFLSLITLYQGVVDLENGVPKEDMELLAPAATLVVREDFHSALPPVILNAARQIHGQGSILSEHNQFPSPRFCSFPLVPEATQYFDRGLSFLYRHLPFRWAAAADRLGILLLPLLGLLIPVVRLLPPVYNWTMKRKIYRRYLELQRIESRIGHVDEEKLLEEVGELDAIVQEFSNMPSYFGADVYTLRSNLQRVRTRLKKISAGSPELELVTVDKSMHRKPGKPPKSSKSPSKKSDGESPSREDSEESPKLDS